MEIQELVEWVYARQGPEEVAMRVEEAQRRFRQTGRILKEVDQKGGQIVAATYFLSLPGRVATLGGTRAEAGSERMAASQVDSLSQQLLEIPGTQIQAVSRADDAATKLILGVSQLGWLTQVAHIYKEINNKQLGSAAEGEREITFRPASDFSLKRVRALLAETFVGTQDCPELNGIRSEQDVMLGFLDGQHLRCLGRWEVVELEGDSIGVLLLNDAGSSATELSYVGIIPSARRKGLGVLLVDRAIRSTQIAGDSLLAAAVDQRNLPALRVYDKQRFKHHVSLDVWLHRSHLGNRS